MSNRQKNSESTPRHTFGGSFNTPARLSLGGRPFYVHKATISDLGKLEEAYKASIPDPVDLVCSIAKSLGPAAAKDFLVSAVPLVIDRACKTITLSDDDVVAWYGTAAGRRAVIDIIAKRSNTNYEPKDIDVLFDNATEEEFSAISSRFVHGDNPESVAAQRLFDQLYKDISPDNPEDDEPKVIDRFPKT